MGPALLFGLAFPAATASGDLERAITAYERLIELGPGRVDLVIYRYYLGSLHHRQGRLERAREELLAGLEVVEYPALRELLEKVDAELAQRGGPPAPTPGSRPTSRPTDD